MPAKKATPSLLDYAKQFERPSCIACILPEREEIDGAYKSGVNRKHILKWLWEVKGYTDQSVLDEDGKPVGISASMLDKHLGGGHHYSKKDLLDKDV